MDMISYMAGKHFLPGCKFCNFTTTWKNWTQIHTSHTDTLDIRYFTFCQVYQQGDRRMFNLVVSGNNEIIDFTNSLINLVKHGCFLKCSPCPKRHFYIYRIFISLWVLNTQIYHLQCNNLPRPSLHYCTLMSPSCIVKCS